MGRFPYVVSLLPFLSLIVIFLSATIAPPQPVAALPLSIDSRWIVDETGHRGLIKQSIDSISKKIVSMGFNCVRLTWPLFLATNDLLANTTVRHSFRNLGLTESIAGFQANNPSIIDHSLISAFQLYYGLVTSFEGGTKDQNHLSKVKSADKGQITSLEILGKVSKVHNHHYCFFEAVNAKWSASELTKLWQKSLRSSF
ncbi:unnamed protein product [Camellia sinensis]